MSLVYQQSERPLLYTTIWRYTPTLKGYSINVEAIEGTGTDEVKFDYNPKTWAIVMNFGMLTNHPVKMFAVSFELLSNFASSVPVPSIASTLF